MLVVQLTVNPANVRASHIPSSCRRVTRTVPGVLMEFTDGTEDHRWPVENAARRTSTLDLPQTSGPVASLVVHGGPGSALVMTVGCQGREKGQFINPQGVCYNGDSDGGLVLVADSNCACVQVRCVFFRYTRRHNTKKLEVKA